MNRSRNIAVILVLLGSAVAVGAYVLIARQQPPPPRPDAAVHRRATKRAPAERPPETVAELRALLSHKREKMRERAVAELARRGPQKDVLAALIVALRHQDNGISTAASTALQAFGPQAASVAPEVAKCIELNQPCAAWAGLVLGSISPAALPQLERIVYAKRSEARSKAAYALAFMRCHGPPVVRLLRRLAKDRHAGTRAIARRALSDPCTRRR